MQKSVRTNIDSKSNFRNGDDFRKMVSAVDKFGTDRERIRGVIAPIVGEGNVDDVVNGCWNGGKPNSANVTFSVAAKTLGVVEAFSIMATASDSDQATRATYNHLLRVERSQHQHAAYPVKETIEIAGIAMEKDELFRTMLDITKTREDLPGAEHNAIEQTGRILSTAQSVWGKDTANEVANRVLGSAKATVVRDRMNCYYSTP